MAKVQQIFMCCSLNFYRAESGAEANHAHHPYQFSFAISFLSNENEKWLMIFGQNIEHGQHWI